MRSLLAGIILLGTVCTGLADTNTFVCPDFVAVGWKTNTPPEILVTLSNTFVNAVSDELKCVFSETPATYCETATGHVWHYRILSKVILVGVTQQLKDQVEAFFARYPEYLDVKMGTNPWLLIEQEGKACVPVM